MTFDLDLNMSKDILCDLKPRLWPRYVKNVLDDLWLLTLTLT